VAGLCYKYFNHVTGGSRLPNWGSNSPLPSPLLPPLSLSLPFSYLPLSPSLPLEVGPLNTASGLGRAVSSPSEFWGRKSNLVHFSLKIWHLVAPIFLIFPNWIPGCCRVYWTMWRIWHLMCRVWTLTCRVTNNVTSVRLWQREFDLACPKPSNQSLNLIL